MNYFKILDFKVTGMRIFFNNFSRVPDFLQTSPFNIRNEFFEAGNSKSNSVSFLSISLSSSLMKELGNIFTARIGVSNEESGIS